MKDIGEFALACDIKKAAEDHFRAIFGSCDTLKFEAGHDDTDYDDEDIIRIKICANCVNYCICMFKS